MRFEQPDTDAIYENVLKPLIESVGFAPRVVNRMNYNDDIDDRIFKELDRCSICVADLTYARPSVYYEAGYARARGVPVVHTVRADHFNRANPDDRQVHFDLQMKNIIGWQNPDDPKFAKDFKARLKLVAEPVLTRLATDQQRLRERSQFAEASVVDRMDHLHKVLGGELIGREYNEIDRPDDVRWPMMLAGLSPTGAIYAKQIGDYQHIVNLVFRNNLKIGEISDQLREHMIPKGLGRKEFSYLTVYVCMNRLTKATLERKLIQLNQDPAAKRFRRRNESKTGKGGELPRHIHEIAFLDAPTSGNDALETFDKILEGSVVDLKRLLPVYEKG